MNDKIEQDVYKVHPLKKICMTIGELPTSYLETMTYYEMLIWFTNFLRDNIIPTVNNNAEAVKELQNLFIELQTYVNNYFDNLDVQDEINNKLDQMLEDGVLEQIIEQYLNSSAIWGFDNVAAMKEATNLIDGSYARTLGYYSANDGGGATYRITDTESLLDQQETLNSGLYATLIVGNQVNVKQLGAKGDKVQNDSPYIQKAINLYPKHKILIPDGNYLIDEPINISSSGTQITGVGLNSHLIKNSATTYDMQIVYKNVTIDFSAYNSIFNLIFPTNSNITNIIIENINLSSDSKSNHVYGIIAPNLTYSIIRSVRFANFHNALWLGGWINTIDNCYFFTNTWNMSQEDVTTFISNTFKNCYFNTGTLKIRSGGASIYSCQADNGNPCYSFIDCGEISMYDCKTETYSLPLRANNSYVNIYGGNFEGHSSQGATFQGFFEISNNSKLYVDNAYIHFEDLASITPSNKNIVGNTSSFASIKGVISTPYTFTNYVGGSNSITICNENVYSLNNNYMSKRKVAFTGGNKVEIFRLPFNYGKNICAKVSGYGVYSHSSAFIDAIITANSIITQSQPAAVDIDVQDNSVGSTKDTSKITISVTAEQDVDNNELVVYFNSSLNYAFAMNCEYEYRI